MRRPIVQTPDYPSNVSVLVADPCWKFSDNLPGEKRGASKHYYTMTVEELSQFPIPTMEKNSILFMWRVASMQKEALELIDAWGFILKSELVWIKTNKDNKSLSFGMGRYSRHCHEVCLIAVKKKGSFKVTNNSIRSVFYAPRGKHSEKPDEFYSIVKQMTEGHNRVELFSRQIRDGFNCYGYDINGVLY